MATITVTNNNDSGPGSLRQAIADAMPGDTINFAPAVSLITLTSGGLLIDKNLTIAGPGAKVLTISGNNSIRVFIILSGVKGTIQGISITNGIAREGGAIYNYGTATLTNCNLSNNTATLDGGGAIWNVVTGTATLTNCTLSNNSSADTGGAIVNLGTATLTNCTLSNNNATSFGGAIYNDGSLGINFNTIANNHSRRDAVIANDVRGSISFKNSIVAKIVITTLAQVQWLPLV